MIVWVPIVITDNMFTKLYDMIFIECMIKNTIEYHRVYWMQVKHATDIVTITG